MEQYEVIKQQIHILRFRIIVEFIIIVIAGIIFYLVNYLVNIIVTNPSTIIYLKLILCLTFLFVFMTSVILMLLIIGKINLLNKKFINLFQERTYKDWVYG